MGEGVEGAGGGSAVAEGRCARRERERWRRKDMEVEEVTRFAGTTVADVIWIYKSYHIEFNETEHTCYTRTARENRLGVNNV